MPSLKKIFITCILLYVTAQVVFFHRIEQPPDLSFDEFFYVPAARQFLVHGENENWSQPPLGKLLIASGMAIVGDRPAGWRLMSSVFGSLTLISIYLLCLSLFRKQKPALFAALLTLFNQLLYVQARIATLDVFMFAFSAFAITSFSYAIRDSALWSSISKRNHLITLAGAFFGLACACKWFATVPWFACLLLLFFWSLKDGIQRWARPLLLMSAIPLLFYFLSYLPLVGMQHPYYAPSLKAGDTQITLAEKTRAVIPPTVDDARPGWRTYPANFPFHDWTYEFFEFLSLQPKMLRTQLGVTDKHHPYLSSWYSWPLMLRPIWYHYDQKQLRGVALLGNPVVMWLGLFSVAFCAIFAIKEQLFSSIFIFGFYSIFLLSWGLIPRQNTYYYYYYPAGMMLGPAISFVFHRIRIQPFFAHLLQFGLLLATIVSFIFFFPVLSSTAMSDSQLNKRLWLNSWR